MKALLALLALGATALAAAALGGTETDRGTATIRRATGAPLVLQVEIARTPAERQRGLMNRRSLGRRSGMVFAFPEDVSGGFWMKNTLIPLDIAFYDRTGRILRILTMQPCRRDPCRVYSPGVAYRGALEVNAHAFRSWNVRAGDRVVVRAR